MSEIKKRHNSKMFIRVQSYGNFHLMHCKGGECKISQTLWKIVFHLLKNINIFLLWITVGNVLPDLFCKHALNVAESSKCTQGSEVQEPQYGPSCNSERMETNCPPWGEQLIYSCSCIIRMTGIDPHIARWLNLKGKLNEKNLIEIG